MTFLDGKNTGTCTAECAKYYEFQCVLLNVTQAQNEFLTFIFTELVFIP